MQQYSCFFFDVDGTLLDNKSRKVPESTLKGIKRLKELGKKCIICSGRGVETLKLVKELDFIEWDGYVLYNGALCLDETYNVLKIDKMDLKALEEIDRISYEKDMVIYYEGMKSWINKPLNQKAHNGLQFLGIHDGFLIKPIIDEDVCMLMAFDDDFSCFDNVEGITVFPTPHHYADIGIKGISKGSGIEVFSKFFNIPMDETMGFGDGNNDIEMIRTVAMGVSMGQGTDRIKAVSNYITDDVDKDGLYNALVHFKCI